MTPAKPREHLFDNLKALTLFCVAFGHILDVYIVKEHSLFQIMMQYIYLFNMPLFSFVTGYFTKDENKARETAVPKVLVPYLVLQILYITMGVAMIQLGLASYNADVFQPSLLLPTSPLYYLLSVFFWKYFLKDIKKLRYPILFSIVAGTLISFTSNSQFHIGIGPTFTLWLFFLLGHFCTPEYIQKIRNLPKWIGWGILLLAILPASLLPYGFRNVHFNYEQAGMQPLEGGLYRILFYAIACLIIIGLINVMSGKKTFFSKIGVNSIIVYAASSFLAPHGYVLLAKIFPALTQNSWINLAGMILFCAVLVLVASFDWIKKIYDTIIQWICHLLFRPEAKN
ncbi:MAG: acyltransferase family protein [Massiliimalia sp.]